MHTEELVKTLWKTDRTIKHCVYCALNKENKKVYIGYTRASLCRRIINHEYCSRNNKSNNYFHSAISKYGRDNFEWFVLHESPELVELKWKETYFINLFKSNDRIYGYNLTTGGDGTTFSEEVCLKIFKKAKERNIIGDRNPFFGKKHSIETKSYLSSVRKGKPCSNKGYRHSDEMKKKLGEIRKELCKNPKVVQNIRDAQKSKAIQCLSNGVIYKSIREASRQLNVHVSGVNAQLHGRVKAHKGLTFKFV